ncbi:cell division protein FtsX [Porphyromonas uenonis]|uniref:cell division protein FtsX n=1 Tax=Porphyromonas uenonis TaxID=281920 RepID=UPI000470C6B1|nr:permease-like cell division protein FtsX [Porphyromonas uenonis]
MSHHTPRSRRRSLLPSSRIIAIVCIALPLFLLGSIALLEVGKCHLEQSVREEMTFTVLLDPETTAQDSIELMQQVQQAPYIKDVNYITPDEAARQLEEEIGEDPVAVLGFNPLQPSLEVHLKSQYAVADSMAQIESDFASWGNVQMMSYRGDMLQMIDENMQHLSTILLIVSLILLIIAIIQVNSMTHIMIYSRRFLIRSMTLLGAKPSLIRKPFTTYSIFNGLWGGLLATCMIIGLLCYMTQRNPLLLQSYLSYSEVAIILGGIICLGILLSWITASISTSRYIRMDGGRIVMA